MTAVRGSTPGAWHLSQYISIAMSTQPGHPSLGRRNEYQPKGGDALGLRSKGRCRRGSTLGLPQYFGYMCRKESSVAFKMCQKAFPVGASPWTPLEDLTTLPQTTYARKGTPSPYLTLLGAFGARHSVPSAPWFPLEPRLGRNGSCVGDR